MATGPTLDEPTLDEPKRGLAWRRHHRFRMRAKAMLVLGFDRPPVAVHHALAVRQADNLSACSCSRCGNPRRWFGIASVKEMAAMTGGDRPRAD